VGEPVVNRWTTRGGLRISQKRRGRSCGSREIPGNPLTASGTQRIVPLPQRHGRPDGDGERPGVRPGKRVRRPTSAPPLWRKCPTVRLAGRPSGRPGRRAHRTGVRPGAGGTVGSALRRPRRSEKGHRPPELRLRRAMEVVEPRLTPTRDRRVDPSVWWPRAAARLRPVRRPGSLPRLVENLAALGSLLELIGLAALALLRRPPPRSSPPAVLVWGRPPDPQRLRRAAEWSREIRAGRAGPSSAPRRTGDQIPRPARDLITSCG
jgi:hypothetical protein